MNHEQHDHTENAAKESSTWPSCCITAKNGITQGKNHTVKSFFFFFSKHYFHSEKHFNDTVENAVLLFFENAVPSSDEIVVHLRWILAWSCITFCLRTDLRLVGIIKLHLVSVSQYFLCHS